MKVDIYKDIRPHDLTRRSFVFVPEGSDLSILPDEILSELGELRLEKSIEILPGEKRLGLQTDEAIEHITTQGFHVQHMDVRIRKSA